MIDFNRNEKINVSIPTIRLSTIGGGHGNLHDGKIIRPHTEDELKKLNELYTREDVEIEGGFQWTCKSCGRFNVSVGMTRDGGFFPFTSVQCLGCEKRFFAKLVQSMAERAYYEEEGSG